MQNYQVGKGSETGYIKMLEGIERKTLVCGTNTILCKFTLAKGKLLPMHTHPHEQTGYLVTGRIIMIINGERHEMQPGDSWTINGNVEHGAEIMEDSLAVEVFSPVRDDYK